jgi:hypothetical protein
MIRSETEIAQIVREHHVPDLRRIFRSELLGKISL